MQCPSVTCQAATALLLQGRGETRHKAPCGDTGMWARKERMSLRGCLGAQWAGGWLGLPTTSSRTSFQRMRLPVSCTKVTLILLWMP